MYIIESNKRLREIKTMTKQSLQSIYEQIGPEKIDELVEAFYPKVYSDPDLIPIFQGDIEEIKYKQRLFLIQFTGGPPLFSEEFGPPMMNVVIYHSRLHQNAPSHGYVVWVKPLKKSVSMNIKQGSSFMNV